MKISLDYKTYGVDIEKLPEEQKNNLASVYEIALSFFKGATSQKYPTGVPTDKLRMLKNVSDKFDKAEQAGLDEIELNPYEVSFLKDNMRDATFEVGNMNGAVAVYDMIFAEDEVKSTAKISNKDK